MYLPRSTPSMSDTATLTRVPGASRTAARALATEMGVGMRFLLACSSRGAMRAHCSPGRGHATRDRPPFDDGPGSRGRDPGYTRPMTRNGALLALHVAVLLFGFSGLFG